MSKTLVLIAWAIASLVAETATAAKTAPPESALESRIDAHLRPFAEAGHLSGVLLVARGGDVLYEKAFGLANREHGVPNTPRTRFAVASITKPMTVVLAARLVEQGRLRREDPLARWIPDFPSADAITVEHLLRHRSGIPHRVTTEAEESLPRTAADVVELAKRRPLAFPPGSQESYSSAGFSVLARVLERAGGRPYGELVEELVFAPAGMTRSAHATSRTILPDRASSYGFSASGFVNAPLKDLSFLVGAGSVWSTASDLHRLMRALVEGRLGDLARQSLLREEGLLWNGITNQYRAFADYHADSGLHVVLTANVHSGAGDRVRQDLPRLVAGESVDPPRVPRPAVASVPAAALERLEGRYEMRPGTLLTVRRDEDGLRANDWMLLPLSATAFFSPQDYSRVEFVTGEGGAVVERLDWIVGERAVPMRRVGPLEEP